MGILADVSHVWPRTLVERGIPALAFAGFFVALVYVLFVDGHTRGCLDQQ